MSPSCSACFVDGGGKASLIYEIALLTGNATRGPRIIALFDPADPPPLAELLQLPIQGCWLKTEINENLLHLVRAVAGGAALLSRVVLTSPPTPRLHAVLTELDYVLTAQEEKIVGLMARGLNNVAIADEIGLAEQTVRNYVHRIYNKLQTNNRAEIVARFQGVVGTSQEK